MMVSFADATVDGCLDGGNFIPNDGEISREKIVGVNRPYRKLSGQPITYDNGSPAMIRKLHSRQCICGSLSDTLVSDERRYSH
jgi:hypothetical protein